MVDDLAPLTPDTHEAQAERVATYLERHPSGCTLAELATACDLGCASKVLSAMTLTLGYGLRKAWRTVRCASGAHTRDVRLYALVHRPRQLQRDLFKNS